MAPVSAARVPELLASHFPEALALVEHFGFTRGRRAEDFWSR